MLRYLREFEVAAAIEHAILVTLEQGTLTGDVLGYDKGTPTSTYTDAIIGNLGKRSERWQVREYKPINLPRVSGRPDFVAAASRAVVGLDVFVESPLEPEELGTSLRELSEGTALELTSVSNRGRQVFPATGAAADMVDHYACRFVIREGPGELSDDVVHDLLTRVSTRHRWMHLEKLQEFDGEPGFTKAQGEN
jgi:isocitrate dehydrogenase